MKMDGFVSTVNAQKIMICEIMFLESANVTLNFQPRGLFCHFRTFLANELRNNQFENLLENEQDREHIRGRQSLKTSE